MTQSKQDVKKYNNASEDPLYWSIAIGFFIFTLIANYFAGIVFAIAWLNSLVGIIIYIMVFKDKRLKEGGNHK